MPFPHTNPVTDYSDPNYTAVYITPRTECRYCHGTPLRFQNNTTVAAKARHDWARSGKGDVTNPAWKNSPTHDWKTTGTFNASPATSVAQDCVRCHVAKGFTQYVGSNFTNISPVGVASDKTSEPLTCNACHNTDSASNPGFTIRAVSNVTAYYNYSSAATKKLIVKFDRFYGEKPFYYPPVPVDNAGSNVCITCHTGRQSGATIKAAANAGLNFSNASFINSHYMSAAGSLYQSTGFYFYTSTRYLPGSAATAHSYAGTEPNYGVPGGGNGPCVACHMNSTAPKHSFKPYERDSSGQITNWEATVCWQCHQYDVTFVQGQQDGFAASLDTLQYLLKLKGIYYNATYPYFFKSEGPYTSANAFKDWNSVYPDKGVNVMGATFNFNLMKREPGAWAHNPVNTKRLLWDSIDFIDDGVMNNSTSVTIHSSEIQSQPFGQGVVNYLDGFRP
jgi:hypothetical protein